MAIRIRPTIDPLSPLIDGPVITAQSEASRLLEHELLRYCDGQMEGCSFLIAGHRGAGKTTMVHDVIRKVKRQIKERRMRPLPVILHGPSLFLTLSELPEDELDETTAEDFFAPDTKTSDEGELFSPGPARNGIEEHAQCVLEQVILSLHKAVAREYADAYRNWVLGRIEMAEKERAEKERAEKETAEKQKAEKQKAGKQKSEKEKAEKETAEKERVEKEKAEKEKVGSEKDVQQRFPDGDSALVQDMAEWPELAAQFEVELMEDPPAARLREFYASIGALETGILSDPSRRELHVSRDQGAREIVALNGICMAHQRISGELSEKEREASQQQRQTLDKLSWHTADVVKPLAAAFSGALAMGGAAAGQHRLWSSALLGLATAVGAMFLFKHSSSSHVKREREVDRTFIPDLSLRTLDRVLPTLLKRLTNAGLAPILVVDELDKMGELSHRIETMVRHLKKLMTENVFSCFLTDRGYLELVNMRERDKAYGKTFSYFSHPFFVVYEPGDLDDYMSRLFDASGDPTAEIDCELLKWVLRHRSQMHALALNREIAALRTPAVDGTAIPAGDIVAITGGEIRSSFVYTIDITFQVAIEHRLNKIDVVRWLQQYPTKRLTLFDALYYISREWRRGEREIDLGDPGLDKLWLELERRMNLHEVRKRGGRNSTDPVAHRQVLNKGDKQMLTGVVRDLALELSKASPEFKPASEQIAGEVPVPKLSVLECVMSGDNSLLVKLDGETPRYGFRYQESGKLQPSDAPVAPPGPGQPPIADVPTQAPVVSAGQQQPPVAGSRTEAPPATAVADESDELSELVSEAANPMAEFIDEFERELAPLFFDESTHTPIAGEIYQLLADEMGVLPTNPAASHIRVAKTRLIDAYHGQNSPEQLQDDMADLIRFAHMIVANYDVIEATLATAAGIGALDPLQPPTVQAVRTGLRALSMGLNFRRHDPAGMRRVLLQFHGNLHDIFPAFPESFSGTTMPSKKPGAGIVESVRYWTDAAKAALSDDKGAWSRVVSRAWTHFGVDSFGEFLAEGDRPARFELTLCAANARGPAMFFGLNPFEPLLEDWTNLVIRVLSEPKSTFEKDADFPPEMFERALLILGFNMLREELVMPYLDRVSKRESAAWYFRALEKAFSLPGYPLSESLSEEIAVVVRAEPHSGTYTWTANPKYQATVVTTLDKLLNAENEGFIELLQATGRIRVIWERAPNAVSRENVMARLRGPQKRIFVADGALHDSIYASGGPKS